MLVVGWLFWVREELGHFTHLLVVLHRNTAGLQPVRCPRGSTGRALEQSWAIEQCGEGSTTMQESRGLLLSATEGTQSTHTGNCWTFNIWLTSVTDTADTPVLPCHQICSQWTWILPLVQLHQQLVMIGFNITSGLHTIPFLCSSCWLSIICLFLRSLLRHFSLMEKNNYHIYHSFYEQFCLFNLNWAVGFHKVYQLWSSSSKAVAVCILDFPNFCMFCY